MYAFKITCWALIIRIVKDFFKQERYSSEVTKIKDWADENR